MVTVCEAELRLRVSPAAAKRISGTIDRFHINQAGS